MVVVQWTIDASNRGRDAPDGVGPADMSCVGGLWAIGQELHHMVEGPWVAAASVGGGPLDRSCNRWCWAIRQELCRRVLGQQTGVTSDGDGSTDRICVG